MIDWDQARPILGEFKEIAYQALPADVYDQVQDYKLRFASKFKSLHIHKLDQVQGNTFYASLKLDGEHGHLWWDERVGVPMLIRHRGYAYVGLPFMDEAKHIFQQAGIKRALIPGELYVKTPQYERTRVFDVISLTKSPKSLADLQRLSFAPFDILALDDVYFDDFGEVWSRINSVFQGSGMQPPPMLITRDRSEIRGYFDRWVNQSNAEGLMVRSDLTFRYKLKAKFTIDAVILGFTAEDQRVTSLLTGLMNHMGQYQVLAHVGKRIPDDLALLLFNTLNRQQTQSEYHEMSKFFVPFHMVRPQHVIEFSTTDMLPERSNGLPVKKALLEWSKKTGYTLQKSSPFANLAHCEFIRMRTDKEPNPQSIRLEQVTDIIFVDIDQGIQSIHFPPPTILKREVFGKELKGKLAIRKFIAFKSNKEAMDTNYLPYVFNYTDYSPNRKTPLQQEVRISTSQEQILEFYQQFLEANIKKGWDPIQS